MLWTITIHWTITVAALAHHILVVPIQHCPVQISALLAFSSFLVTANTSFLCPMGCKLATRPRRASWKRLQSVGASHSL